MLLHIKKMPENKNKDSNEYLVWTESKNDSNQNKMAAMAVNNNSTVALPTVLG